MRFRRIFTGVLITLWLVLGCEEQSLLTVEEDLSNAKAAAGETIYFNSFEADTDTSGWRGYGSMEFRQDAPKDGGKRSIYVSGGCLVPHGYLNLGPLPENGRFIIQCWGKNLALGGGVTLSTPLFSNEIFIHVDNDDWTFYESSDTLYGAAHQALTLSLSSGGIVASAMLVDLIKVIKVE